MNATLAEDELTLNGSLVKVTAQSATASATGSAAASPAATHPAAPGTQAAAVTIVGEASIPRTR